MKKISLFYAIFKFKISTWESCFFLLGIVALVIITPRSALALTWFGTSTSTLTSTTTSVAPVTSCMTQTVYCTNGPIGDCQVPLTNAIVPVDDGTPCDDGNNCTTGGTCQDGVCGTPVTCPQCQECRMDTGQCSGSSSLYWTSCDDGNRCNGTDDRCNQLGECKGCWEQGTSCTSDVERQPIVCTALGQCYDVGTCDSSTGQCTNPIKADGTSCDDGNVCDGTNDTCIGGNCGPGPNAQVITCSGPPGVSDTQCYTIPGTCDPQFGGCTYRSRSGKCDDGDDCTYDDTCSSGVCRGTSLSCTSDMCNIRTCNGTSQCSVAYRNAGYYVPRDKTCADGDDCTVDSCDGKGGCQHSRDLNKCLINGICYGNGTVNPKNICQVCNPDSNKDGWSNRSDGTQLANDNNPCTQNICNNGRPYPLIPNAPPNGIATTESCNNIDDNCNGSTDENLSRSCYTAPDDTQGVGLCRAGTQTCSEGTWSTTCTGQATPSTEICDGRDNNCNDQTDEGLSSTTCGVGACQRTVQNCLNGVPQTCTAGQPSAEICDGIDNDCNGTPDNGATCPDSSRCENGRCISTDPCAGVICGPCDTCSGGSCQRNADAECTGGDLCDLDPQSATFCQWIHPICTLDCPGNVTRGGGATCTYEAPSGLGLGSECRIGETLLAPDRPREEGTLPLSGERQTGRQTYTLTNIQTDTTVACTVRETGRLRREGTCRDEIVVSECVIGCQDETSVGTSPTCRLTTRPTGYTCTSGGGTIEQGGLIEVDISISGRKTVTVNCTKRDAPNIACSDDVTVNPVCRSLSYRVEEGEIRVSCETAGADGIRITFNGETRLTENRDCSEVSFPFPTGAGTYTLDGEVTGAPGMTPIRCQAQSVAGAACRNGITEPGEQCDPSTSDTSICINCRNVVCGDGIKQGAEECDGGNTDEGRNSDTGRCTTACKNAVCGDGQIQAVIGEQCDDKNTTNGDGCDSTCLAERCGNNVRQTGEECDDGNTAAGDGCSVTCQTERVEEPPPPPSPPAAAEPTIPAAAPPVSTGPPPAAPPGGEIIGGDEPTAASKRCYFFCRADEMEMVNVCTGEVTALENPCPRLPVSEATDPDRFAAAMVVSEYLRDPKPEVLKNKVQPAVDAMLNQWMQGKTYQLVKAVTLPSPTPKIDEESYARMEEVEPEDLRSHLNEHFEFRGGVIETKSAFSDAAPVPLIPPIPQAVEEPVAAPPPGSPSPVPSTPPTVEEEKADAGDKEEEEREETGEESLLPVPEAPISRVPLPGRGRGEGERERDRERQDRGGEGRGRGDRAALGVKTTASRQSVVLIVDAIAAKGGGGIGCTLVKGK